MLLLLLYYDGGVEVGNRVKGHALLSRITRYTIIMMQCIADRPYIGVRFKIIP